MSDDGTSLKNRQERDAQVLWPAVQVGSLTGRSLASIHSLPISMITSESSASWSMVDLAVVSSCMMHHANESRKPGLETDALS